MKAEIIAVGTEILTGQIVNTNAQFLSEKLASLGIDVYFQTAVGDNENRLLSVLEIAKERSDLIVLTRRSVQLHHFSGYILYLIDVIGYCLSIYKGNYDGTENRCCQRKG